MDLNVRARPMKTLTACKPETSSIDVFPPRLAEGHRDPGEGTSRAAQDWAAKKLSTLGMACGGSDFVKRAPGAGGRMGEQ